MANLSIAINHYLQALPQSPQEITYFLNLFAPAVQLQLISAIYHGRDHLHSFHLRTDQPITTENASHISLNEYFAIILEKGTNIESYLKKFAECAHNSGFDINLL